jgi:hypothetical protein
VRRYGTAAPVESLGVDTGEDSTGVDSVIMSSPLKLQKWQANQLFDAIQVAGLDPREFNFQNNDDAEVRGTSV